MDKEIKRVAGMCMCVDIDGDNTVIWGIVLFLTLIHIILFIICWFVALFDGMLKKYVEQSYNERSME